jgi:hypothetical protein
VPNSGSFRTLQANQTRTQVFKKSQNLFSAQRPTHNNFALAIDSVNLKNALGHIKAELPSAMGRPFVYVERRVMRNLPRH